MMAAPISWAMGRTPLMPAVRNQETLDCLCSALARNAGDKAAACAEIGVSTGWLKGWIRDDPKVEAAIEDAVDTGTMALESAMIKRAVEGVKEPVFYKENKVGHRRKYSDALLIKLVEARKPDQYGKKSDVNVNVNIRQLSDNELDAKIEMLLSRTALPAPAQVIEGEFVELREKEEISVEDLL
jgi:hypothetical protein